MGGMRLVVGWNPLLEADLAALPALCGLCQALEIRTHWDEASQTLHVESPLMGKRLAIQAASTVSSRYLAVAEAVGDRLRALLGGAGATILSQHDDLSACDLLVQVDVGSHPQWGISTAHNWLGRNQSRNPAALMAEHAATTGELPNLGSRVSHGGMRSRGAPCIEVLIGRPTAADTLRLSDERFPALVAEGLARGIADCWTNPIPVEIHRSSMSVSPAEEVATPPLADPLSFVIDALELAVANFAFTEPEQEPAVDETPMNDLLDEIEAIMTSQGHPTPDEPSAISFGSHQSSGNPESTVWLNPAVREATRGEMIRGSARTSGRNRGDQT